MRENAPRERAVPSETAPTDFIRDIVRRDVASGKHGGRVATRFPPEPNGFLHIGHAKAICLDFGVAEEFGGTCNLRMDDTNPETEDPAYVRAIEEDIRWLGFEWEGDTRYASDYFEAFYELALGLIEDGLAYVDSSSEEEIRARRGTVTEPGRPGPYRDRPAGESLELFRAMRAGEFEDGAHVLRAKIDLAASNMKMRDPLLYRIKHAHHYRTAEEWPIYPFYDWAHCLEDAIEGITHSFCTLEFENNREIYDWVLDHTRPGRIGLSDSDAPGAWDPRSRQYEFARLNLDYTVMSKRKLGRLVREGRVEGWDDPRMPTLAGLRRRGVPPDAIRAFCTEVGISKADQRVQVSKLEYATRDVLNRRAPRVMAVLRPLRLVVESYPEDREERLEVPHFPRDVEAPPGDWPETREVPFCRELWIEREDFREDPPEGYWRLSPGREVRLRHAYLVTCTDVVRDEDGAVVEVRCRHDPGSRGGSAPDGRVVRGTLHWVSARHALPAEVRLYDRLFAEPDPEADADDFRESLNPRSLEVVTGARIEPSVATDPPATRYQFERQGYFVRDPDSRPETLVFNRTVPLRDAWARRESLRDRAVAGDEVETKVEPTAEEERHGGGEAGRTAAEGGSERPGHRRSEARDRAREAAPALAEKFERYREELGLSEEDADILTGRAEAAAFFEDALAEHAEPGPVANWIIHEVRGAMGDRRLEDLPFGGAAVGRLVALVEGGTISQRVGRDVLERMLEGGGDPRAIVEAEGLERIDDAAELEPVIDRVLARHPDEVSRYREGQRALTGFFIGQVMRDTEGRADPRLVRRLLVERLPDGA